MKLDVTMGKRELIRRAQSLDDRRVAQIERQIDSINRLLGDESPHKYEHEMEALNTRLTEMDDRLKVREDQIIQVVRAMVPLLEDPVFRKFAGEVLNILDEGVPAEVTSEVTDASFDRTHRARIPELTIDTIQSQEGGEWQPPDLAFRDSGRPETTLRSPRVDDRNVE